VWNGKDFDPRLMLPLSLSYDHRVINGADAARFTTKMKKKRKEIKKKKKKKKKHTHTNVY
ncbi:2-oxo acid dehydrogenase subunit E2, partial [Acinetobacter baumannii]|uniref:2-oxo acid dehydrogenase subunit E2 n=1 Tax=Acinetobacter baumannii TaxID=470 RepID=UPI001C4637C8